VDIDRTRMWLEACPPEVALMEAIRLALIDFNRVEPAQASPHRRRMELILRVPALLTSSTLRFTTWWDVVAEFVADRTQRRPE
jgi:TetR/AcrR family transcriptional regulator, regulator of mycofactocin system